MTTIELIEADSQPEPGDSAPEVAPRAEQHRPGWLRPVTTLRPRGLRFRLTALTLAVVVLGGGFLGWRMRPVTNPALAGTKVVSVDELESIYGAHIDLVALLAGGGLIEMRFQVSNADKAQALFGTTDQMPRLAVQGSDLVLESAKGMKHSFTVLDGATYFMLYPNPANQVHQGTKVSLVFNGYRIPDLTVQK